MGGGTSLIQYDVTCSSGVNLSNPVAIKGRAYSTDLSIDHSNTLPSELDLVTINGAAFTKYTYELDESLDRAKFSIPRDYITGTIDIKLTFGNRYISSVVTEGETIVLSNTTVNTLVDYETEMSFDPTTYSEKKMPKTLTSVTSGGISIAEYTYLPDVKDKNKATLKINKSLLKGDVVITLKLDNFDWYDYPDWWNRCGLAKATDVGREVTVEVNGLQHLVRLIDFDDESNDTRCTFEFENVISYADERGETFPILSKYDEENNFNFPNSTLNKFLNGTSGEITGTVLEMLPEDLRNKIKEVEKKVATVSDGEYIITSYNTKLFPLAHDEISTHSSWVLPGEAEENEQFDYYTNHGPGVDETRIKKVVNGKAKSYWLRSPDIDKDPKPMTDVAGVVLLDGSTSPTAVTAKYFTVAIAPAFCI